MARTDGDTNFTLREARLKAEHAAMKAKLEAEKAAGKVKDAKLAELKEKLRLEKMKK